MEAMEEYMSDGTIYTSSLMQAVMWEERTKEGNSALMRLRDEVLQFYDLYLPQLKAIAATNAAIETLVDRITAEWWLPTVQPYYVAATQRGHVAMGQGYKALLWGCAGRVLLTLQDVEEHGKFGGAWISLIFPEDVTTRSRGRLQGLCATHDEALALLTAALSEKPAFTPDSSVTLAGL